MFSVGIVGFGKMGMLHGALMNGSGKAKITAICDKSFIMRFGFKRFYKGVKCYKNLDSMLNSNDLDAVIISTPSFNHVESTMKAIEKGCAVFVEKPLASNYKSAEDLSKFAQSHDGRIQVGFCNRFAPTISYGRKLLKDGVIGSVKSVDACTFISDVLEKHSGWRYKKAISGGGVLMDFGIHMIDLLLWYFGDVKDVCSVTKKLYSEEVEDELQSEIQFASGVNAHFETSWSKENYRKSYIRIEITGSEGKLIITDQTVNIYNKQGEMTGDLTYPDLYGGAYMDIGGVLYSKQMEAFFDLLYNGTTSGSTLEEAVYVQKIVDCIYKSAESGMKIAVGDLLC